jgi:hypothetical protein
MILTALFLTVFFSNVQQARAALYLQINLSDSNPRVGETVDISIFTFAIQSESNRACVNSNDATRMPFVVENISIMEVTAHHVDTADSYVVITLHQRPDNPLYWDGSIAFHLQGQWTLRVTNPSWESAYEECAGAKVTLNIDQNSALNMLSYSPSRSTLNKNTALSIGATVALAGLISLLAILKKTRGRPQ